jgi:hypothetical protein
MAVVSSAGYRGHGPVGVDFYETAKFSWGDKGITWIDNRGRLRGLNWSPEQHCRGARVGCSFSSGWGQESKRPASLDQIIGDLFE